MLSQKLSTRRSSTHPRTFQILRLSYTARRKKSKGKQPVREESTLLARLSTPYQQPGDPLDWLIGIKVAEPDLLNSEILPLLDPRIDRIAPNLGEPGPSTWYMGRPPCTMSELEKPLPATPADLFMQNSQTGECLYCQNIHSAPEVCNGREMMKEHDQLSAANTDVSNLRVESLVQTKRTPTPQLPQDLINIQAKQQAGSTKKDGREKQSQDSTKGVEVPAWYHRHGDWRGLSAAKPHECQSLIQLVFSRFHWPNKTGRKRTVLDEAVSLPHLGSVQMPPSDVSVKQTELVGNIDIPEDGKDAISLRRLSSRQASDLSATDEVDRRTRDSQSSSMEEQKSSSGMLKCSNTAKAAGYEKKLSHRKSSERQKVEFFRTSSLNQNALVPLD